MHVGTLLCAQQLLTSCGSGGKGANSSSSFFGSPVLCAVMPAFSMRSCSSLAATPGLLRSVDGVNR